MDDSMWQKFLGLPEYERLPGCLQSEYSLRDYYKNGYKYTMKPFRIYGNLYFVGDKDVCCHLIDTGEGLILIDTGYPHQNMFLLQNIYELGFNPKDLKYIIHTHGHFDHFGATNGLVAISGAETFLGWQDAELLEKDFEKASLNIVAYHSYSSMFKVDHLMYDGDIIKLGNTTIRVVDAPGHSPGVKAFFFNVTENGKTLTAGLHGGVGFCTMHLLHMHLFGNKTAQKDFIWGLDRVMDEKVDITLGNHTSQNRTEAKYEYMMAHPDEPNPFVDANEWPSSMREIKKKFLEMVAYESENFQPLLDPAVGYENEKP